MKGQLSEELKNARVVIFCEIHNDTSARVVLKEMLDSENVTPDNSILCMEGFSYGSGKEIEISKLNNNLGFLQHVRANYKNYEEIAKILPCISDMFCIEGAMQDSIKEDSHYIKAIENCVNIKEKDVFLTFFKKDGIIDESISNFLEELGSLDEEVIQLIEKLNLSEQLEEIKKSFSNLLKNSGSVSIENIDEFAKLLQTAMEKFYLFEAKIEEVKHKVFLSIQEFNLLDEIGCCFLQGYRVQIISVINTIKMFQYKNNIDEFNNYIMSKETYYEVASRAIGKKIRVYGLEESVIDPNQTPDQRIVTFDKTVSKIVDRLIKENPNNNIIVLVGAAHGLGIKKNLLSLNGELKSGDIHSIFVQRNNTECVNANIAIRKIPENKYNLMLFDTIITPQGRNVDCSYIIINNSERIYKQINNSRGEAQSSVASASNGNVIISDDSVSKAREELFSQDKNAVLSCTTRGYDIFGLVINNSSQLGALKEASFPEFDIGNEKKIILMNPEEFQTFAAKLSNVEIAEQKTKSVNNNNAPESHNLPASVCVAANNIAQQIPDNVKPIPVNERDNAVSNSVYSQQMLQQQNQNTK